VTDNPPVHARTFQPPSGGEQVVFEGRRYTIGKQIGQGAFGTVYECTDEWGNELAAKVLLPRNRPYEEIRDHCIREFEKLRALRHPNITFIYDAFVWRDTFYLILERCALTLLSVINTPKLQPDSWIPWVARDILQGLNYIHSHGYVHKDVHPGNVFASLAQDKMVPSKPPVWSFKIADLGIAGLEAELRPNTQWAQWMLPPEVIDPAEFGAIGRTVDTYHTGLLLLALTMKAVPNFTKEEITAGKPRQLAEASTSKYGQIIGVALRRHPAVRFQTAIDFWRAISAASK
jgi:serine/threonine-protein kinase